MRARHSRRFSPLLTCTPVDDDQVVPQEGDFYGSWITPEITGGDKGFKGGAGTWGW